ncbi:MAG: outer membrane protein assembly factor BamE [Ferrovum sp.]|nr:outer membrane protein assembly factor BamE [Ferrovum sp.]NDU87342.1 outer membrane protein assembly factor BamE [Ferrovum sp.]
MKIAVKKVGLVGLGLLMGGCSTGSSWVDYIPGSSWLKPYTLDVQQGVIIDSEMVSRLKEGMTRAQVAFTLGTPLLKDPFHQNRWDYIYYVRTDGKLSEPHNLTVYFTKDVLARYETNYAFDKPVADAGAAPAPAAPPVAVPAQADSPSGVSAAPADGPVLDSSPPGSTTADTKGNVLDTGK